MALRPELEDFMAEISKNAPSAIKALTLIDAKLPVDKPILALSFGGPGYGDYGLLVVTDRRFIYVGDGVQSWQVEEINKVGSNDKDIFSIDVAPRNTTTFGNLTNGPKFSATLNAAINESKLGAL